MPINQEETINQQNTYKNVNPENFVRTNTKIRFILTRVCSMQSYIKHGGDGGWLKTLKCLIYERKCR